MSARAYHRILKLARTMARKAGLDLAGSDEIQTAHLAKPIFIGRDSVPAEKADVTHERSKSYL